MTRFNYPSHSLSLSTQLKLGWWLLIFFSFLAKLFCTRRTLSSCVQFFFNVFRNRLEFFFIIISLSYSLPYLMQTARLCWFVDSLFFPPRRSQLVCQKPLFECWTRSPHTVVQPKKNIKFDIHDENWILVCNEFLAFENHTAEQREESKNFAQIRFRTPFIVKNYEAEGENVEVVGARAEEARIIVEKNRWHTEKKLFNRFLYYVHSTRRAHYVYIATGPRPPFAKEANCTNDLHSKHNNAWKLHWGA